MPSKHRAPDRGELEEIFAAAEEMTGCGDPDTRDAEIAKIRRVRQQLWRALGWKDTPEEATDA